jgi:polyhydroxybutyrate depolymerase
MNTLFIVIARCLIMVASAAMLPACGGGGGDTPPTPSAVRDYIASVASGGFNRSYGGMMSLRLACQLANKVVAAAPVAANLPSNLSATCRPTRAVPMMFVHGTADTLMPRQGGAIAVGAGGEVLSTTACVALWNQLNSCPSSGTQRTFDTVADGTSINSTVYAGCAGGAENRFDDVIGGGHTWPGGAQYAAEALIGKTSDDMNASLEIWRFVSRFSF